MRNAQCHVTQHDARTGTRTRTPLRERDFKSLASTRFAIPALLEIQRREPKSMVERAYTQSLEPPHSNPRLPYSERETGLEPATPTLARLCSTN